MHKQDIKIGDLVETVIGDRLAIVTDIPDIYNFVLIYVFDKEDNFAINVKRLRKLS